ncbi:MAG: acyltransferase [Ruminococcaceae bacterium]|nr:acyltransferase [Oscillospiraceae bacterium]
MIKKFLKWFYFTKIKKWDSAQIRLYHLRKIGMEIGEKTYIFSDEIETAEPYLVKIGNNVMIAPGVKFTTHDASASFYIPGASDLFGKIEIGNNCFIGMGAIVLPGVKLADNCIVAAGSVVTKSFCEENSVIAGNPAKKISTTEELNKKNEKYVLNTWGMSFQEKKNYLLANENKFKGN